ncbi:hypothetical protein O181_072332 [Austropuccinia psidii MF-1]|uniref:Uncharacterized protein n=1 Tax=Austropuccinia psidii MF-1 TaxID=1389203 RepID=A0A9Q3IA18_9BASI|nr:hypothetical protein [Austropuccinia psidii MF-1]
MALPSEESTIDMDHFEEEERIIKELNNRIDLMEKQKKELSLKNSNLEEFLLILVKEIERILNRQVSLEQSLINTNKKFYFLLKQGNHPNYPQDPH